jgi:hypothetical protein
LHQTNNSCLKLPKKTTLANTTIGSTSTLPDWQNQLRRTYFVRSADGSIYARIEIKAIESLPNLFFALPFSFDILTMCSLVALDIFELSLFVSNGVKFFPSCAAMDSSFLRHS